MTYVKMEGRIKERLRWKEAYGYGESGSESHHLGEGAPRWVRGSPHLKHSLLKIRLKDNLETTQGITLMFCSR